jgi:hypothetical protein
MPQADRNRAAKSQGACASYQRFELTRYFAAKSLGFRCRLMECIGEAPEARVMKRIFTSHADYIGAAG